eukprot:TRINITY_DN5752_c0_g1_i2.p1 TRINITY_DN5752_c0_g1~~TRINITY_DN5752_c0_g1_i2.p1  ORF type:complete len:773 (+),score=110.24 TRINITY_DN5752_c0_g1_i2:98-2416(+)
MSGLLGFVLCVVTCCVILVVAQPPYNSKQILLGRDLPGMPLPIKEKGGDGQSCAFMCNSDLQCRGYNWLPSGCSDPRLGLHCNDSFPNGCCWLKAEASSLNTAYDVKCGGSFIIRPDPATIPVFPITPAPSNAKNVLYILADDMRPDAVPFGASFMHTPHLRNLASSPGGVYFSGAYCNIAVCSPSRMSFLTGKYPHHTLTWNFINHIRQATCREYPHTHLGETSSAFRSIPIHNGGAGQCCSWCSADSKCAAWFLHVGGDNCTLYEKAAKTPTEAPVGSIGGLRGSTDMQQNLVTLPQHFTKNGYYTLSTGKIFHTEEGGSGPEPWDGEGTGMPPLQDPPSWSQVKPSILVKSEQLNAQAVAPGNSSMYNVNSMAPMRPCNWDSCSIPSNLEGDVEPPVFRFCDRIIGDDALLKLDAAATNYRASGQPFLLGIGFRKPHLPFRHPSAYDSLYPDIKNIQLAKYKVLNESVPVIAFHQTDLAENPFTPMDDTKAATLRRNYYSAISWVDYNIGRVLSELDTLGLTNDTLVVFHTDHGWSLGEHGQWEKFTNWEHGTRVPLIVRAPWLGSRSGKVPNIVELIDIFPTMAELAGITVPQSYKLDGSSLASLVTSTVSSSADSDRKITQNAGQASSDIPNLEYPTLNSYSLTVYPRCPLDMSDPSRYWAQNTCLMKERSSFPFIGVSLRVPDWRYTEWLKWNGTALSPHLDSEPIGVELYSHAGDDGTSFDGPYEQFNLAGLSEYEKIQNQLAAMLRTVYPKGSAWPSNSEITKK